MKYRTYDVRCQAWVEGNPGEHWCSADGRELTPRGYVLCFEHNLVFERDRVIKLQLLSNAAMLVIDEG